MLQIVKNVFVWPIEQLHFCIVKIGSPVQINLP